MDELKKTEVAFWNKDSEQVCNNFNFLTNTKEAEA
jgi:hypothetical protein